MKLTKNTHVYKKIPKYVFRKCGSPDRFDSCADYDMKYCNFHRLIYTCVSLYLSAAKRVALHELYSVLK